MKSLTIYLVRDDRFGCVRWLCFYAALTFKIWAEGVDLLCSQVEIARGLEEQWDISQVHFSCGDARNASLKNVGVIMTTGEVWDADLRLQVVDRIARDASVGTVVVEYRSDHHQGLQTHFTTLLSHVDKVS